MGGELRVVEMIRVIVLRGGARRDRCGGIEVGVVLRGGGSI